MNKRIIHLMCYHPKERVRKKNIKRLKRNFNAHSVLIIDGKVVPPKVRKQIMKKSLKEEYEKGIPLFRAYRICFR